MNTQKEMIVGDPKRPTRTARQKFLELYAEPMVVNSYLKVAVLILAVVSAGLLVVLVRTQAAAHNLKPLVVRINDVGRAEAVDYASFEYKPLEADNRYFLSQWARLFYSRNRYTIQKDLTQALFFLNGDLQAAVIEQNKKSKTVENFLLDPSAPNVDVEIKNVAIEDLRTAPYRARIDFYKIYTNPMDHTETKRELWTANVVYTFRDRVPNDMLLVNPLGLTITYFREDQAFQQ